MNRVERESVILSKDSYNICPGGQGGFGYINSILTIEQKSQFGRLGYKKINPHSLYNCHLGGLKGGNLTGRSNLLKAREVSWSEETRKKRLSTYDMIEHQVGLKNSQYGTCWLTNGQENKKVKKDMVDFFISLGYYKGRIVKK
jgi:hypothetical protein